MNGQMEGDHGSSAGQVSRWLVIRTKPLQERTAVHHLAQREVSPYCPMFLQPPWHPRAPRGPVPLFPGYIFVQCDPERQLNAVRYCPAVIGPVAFGGNVAAVDDELIVALRQREGSRGYALPVEQEEGIPEGSQVRVMSGPFAGFEGVFRGFLRGRERARILVEFLRGRRRIEVDANVLAVLRA